MYKALNLWLPGYLASILRRPRHRGGVRHLIFCLADHFEPVRAEPDPVRRGGAVREWLTRYGESVAGFRDADGRMPRHTFFYPAEDADRESLAPLAEACHTGWGEVEIHLHHRNDTAAGLAAKLTEFRDRLHREYGLLGRDAAGRIRYGFVHGNWALCNSRPDGDWCGVNAELSVLADTGCYADFTFPSAPSPTQPRMVNALYRATDRGPYPRAADFGVRCRVGEELAGDRRQETGDRRQETGDRRQEIGDRRQETGDRRQETGDRRQEIGDRSQESEENRNRNPDSEGERRGEEKPLTPPSPAGGRGRSGEIAREVGERHTLFPLPCVGEGRVRGESLDPRPFLDSSSCLLSSSLSSSLSPSPLLIIQGPLGLNFRRRKWGIWPRLENGALTGVNPPTPDRVDLWVRQGIHVRGRPDWIFVKVHTHGFDPNGRVLWKNGGLARMYADLEERYNDGARWRLHYVTAREMANLVGAAVAGKEGDPGEWRDWGVRR